MALAGCGGAKSDAPAAAAAASPLAPAPSASPAGKAQTATSARAKPVKPSVAPEVVLPSTTDARSQAVLAGDWEGRVTAALKQVDARLVADQPGALKKVRATCRQMETGMFSTKVIPIIEKRFSTAQLTVTQAMAQDIYAVLLQDACYNMNES